jgi:putative PIN family toxin of toxin-antitoxin system
MAELRVVVDTNVAVSAVLLPGSKPRQAFDLAAKAGRLLLSQSTLMELDEVLRRPKFDKYVSERQRLEFLLALVDQAHIVTVVERIQECRDEDDNKFLEVAAAGAANHINSGDPDLLGLNPFRGILIQTPAAFVDQIDQSGSSR